MTVVKPPPDGWFSCGCGYVTNDKSSKKKHDQFRNCSYQEAQNDMVTMGGGEEKGRRTTERGAGLKDGAYKVGPTRNKLVDPTDAE